MSVTSATTATTTRALPAALAWRALVAPVGLYLAALVVRLLAAASVPFSLTAGSAYYVAVARNIAAGRGPVIDTLWSYATPPLTLPRQAFELWQPMASVIAAWPMKLLGPSFASAQLGFAVFGALLAPLAWWVARDAARRLDLPADRATAVSIGTGLLVALGAPFVLAAAVPDSTLPFAVLGVAACIAMPAAAKGNPRALIALGLLLGLAYLTRTEAIFLGIVFIGIAWRAQVRGRTLIGRIGAVAVIGAVVALPWWLRNIAAFGTPLPGQLADNAFLVRSDQIFAWRDQPTLAGFLAQGPLTILANIVDGARHNVVDVLFVPGTFIVVAGVVALIVGWRRRRDLRATPLEALLVYGAIAFVVTSVAFPLATVWGTFMHASGPLLVAFAVLAMLGGDALVARVRVWRTWPRPNAWLAPAALIALSLVMMALQLTDAASQASQRERQVAVAAAFVRSTTALDARSPVITDRPIWLSDALGVPALALPDEDSASVLDLARTFGATNVVILDGDVRSANQWPATCFTEMPGPPPQVLEYAPFLRVLTIAEACR